MEWVFRKECGDCKYCKDAQCTHPHWLYCQNCEFWTPKWYDCKHYDAELDCCKISSSWATAMPVLKPCIDGYCKYYSSLKHENFGEC